MHEIGGSWDGNVGGWNKLTLVIGDPITDGSHGTPRTSSETRSKNILLRYCIKT